MCHEGGAAFACETQTVSVVGGCVAGGCVIVG